MDASQLINGKSPAADFVSRRLTKRRTQPTLRQTRMLELDREYKRQSKQLARLSNSLKHKLDQGDFDV
jgi:hypothetical protein